MSLIARFLPSLVPGLGAFLNPWVLLVLIAFGAACFGAGVQVEGWRWDASLKIIAESRTAFVKSFYQRNAKINAEVASKLAADRDQLARDQRQFEEKLRATPKEDLVELSCPGQPAGQPAEEIPGAGYSSGLRPPAAVDPGVPGVRLSAAAVSLWNDGLAVGLPDAYGGWRADAEAGGAGPVEIKDALANVKDNGAVANVLRSQLLGWQRTACLKGWWSGPECEGLK